MDYPTTCIQCGKSFEGKRADTKYCSSTCRSRASREANGDGGAVEGSTDFQTETPDRIELPAPSRPKTTGEDIDYPLVPDPCN